MENMSCLALNQIPQYIIMFLYAKAKSKGNRIPEYSLGIPPWLLYLLITVFSVR